MFIRIDLITGKLAEGMGFLDMLLVDQFVRSRYKAGESFSSRIIGKGSVGTARINF
jgi:hypothetical protein